jgi:predicted Rossmann-fold nucleotide-binding protein
MEAGHVGAGRENSMGINIMLPFEQGSNPVIAGDPKLVHMKYFFTRKLMFVKECDALCLLPGGFGTLDEATEVLTLLQTGKRDLVPVVFLDAAGGDFWKPFQSFVTDRLAAQGMISDEDLSLYLMTDNLDRAVQEIVGFYRVYHSMRYVREQLVFRLTQKPTAELMERINQDFADILVDGQFTAGEALREEHDEPAFIALPRLVFHFNRRSLGRLRQLVDFINRETVLTLPAAAVINNHPRAAK